MSDTQAIAARLTAIAERLEPTYRTTFPYAHYRWVQDVEDLRFLLAQVERWKKLGDSVAIEDAQLQALATELRVPVPEDRQGYTGKHTMFSVIRFLLAHVETLTQQVAELTKSRTEGLSAQADEIVLLEKERDSARLDCDALVEARQEAEQQRDAAHAALKKWGHHSANCDAIKRVVKRVEWGVDPVTDEPEPSYHYDTNQGACTCGLDAALAASAPQKEEQ